jgi:mono/diheme cytochrome c family protein
MEFHTMRSRTARISSRILFSVCLGILPLSALAGNAANGQILYQKNCSGCHGINGVSNMPQAPDLARTEIFIQTDMQLTEVMRDGRGMMPPFLGILKGTDFADIAAYLRTLH